MILISRKGKTVYNESVGFSNIENWTILKSSDQFVIGSISKQFTAVLILLEMERGHLKLHDPIHKYLPFLTQTWADTVTIHQLLTHTHGITELDKPLSFAAGTQFAYSQIGYHLLAQIAENTSGQSFKDLSLALFTKYQLKNTFHPDFKNHKNLVNSYTEAEDGKLKIEKASFENNVAAGGFISTADDLTLWNIQLFGGKILRDSTLQLMTTKQKYATREHPIFGATDYGYGITVDTKDGITQYGQTGFVPGFTSMSYYFPQSAISLVVLDNTVWDPNDVKKAFDYHTRILHIVRDFMSYK